MFPKFRCSLKALFVISIVATGLHAAPYGPKGLPIEWTQPDGTKQSLRVLDHEFHGRAETLDCCAVVFDPVAKSYESVKGDISTRLVQLSHSSVSL